MRRWRSRFWRVKKVRVHPGAVQRNFPGRPKEVSGRAPRRLACDALWSGNASVDGAVPLCTHSACCMDTVEWDAMPRLPVRSVGSRIMKWPPAGGGGGRMTCTGGRGGACPRRCCACRYAAGYAAGAGVRDGAGAGCCAGAIGRAEWLGCRPWVSGSSVPSVSTSPAREVYAACLGSRRGTAVIQACERGPAQTGCEMPFGALKCQSNLSRPFIFLRCVRPGQTSRMPQDSRSAMTCALRQASFPIRNRSISLWLAEEATLRRLAC